MNIVYLNGKYLPEDQALVSVFDRGFMFGDGIYEVIPVYWRQPFRWAQHLERLTRNLTAIRMHDPLSAAQWAELLAHLIRFNPAPGDQSVYVQITRGPARRDHAIPQETTKFVFSCICFNPTYRSFYIIDICRKYRFATHSIVN